jgi:type IV pilus assembly protein PilE
MHKNISIQFKKYQQRRTAHELGFTLIELMIVVAIIAILAAIAMPSYASYLNKQRMRTAQADLVVLAAHMENVFQRTLAYPGTTTTTAGTETALASWQPSDDKFFDFLISASSAEAFTVQAVGKGALSGCNILLTQANVRTTSGCTQGGGAWL